jgi:hypothetical protein
MFVFLLVVLVIVVVGMVVVKFLDLSRKFEVLEAYTASVATLEDVDERIHRNNHRQNT